MSTHVYLAHKNRKPRRKVAAISRQQLEAGQVPGFEGGVMLDSQYLLITALLPPAVNEFLAQCEAEVSSLCGRRYSHGPEHLSRWGTQAGSIYLGGQKVAIERPRVRSEDGEQKLAIYEQFQDPKLFDQHVFQEGLRRVTQRDYATGLPKIAASFGMSKSKVSRTGLKQLKISSKSFELGVLRNLESLLCSSTASDLQSLAQWWPSE
jgi:putative transposase